MKKNIIKIMVVGIFTITMIGSITGKKKINEFIGESNTTNLKSGYSITLFDDNTPVEDDKKEEVKNPTTGLDDYMPYAIGGIVLVVAIGLYLKNKNKVYKI